MVLFLSFSVLARLQRKGGIIRWFCPQYTQCVCRSHMAVPIFMTIVCQGDNATEEGPSFIQFAHKGKWLKAFFSLKIIGWEYLVKYCIGKPDISKNHQVDQWGECLNELHNFFWDSWIIQTLFPQHPFYYKLCNEGGRPQKKRHDAKEQQRKGWTPGVTR